MGCKTDGYTVALRGTDTQAMEPDRLSKRQTGKQREGGQSRDRLSRAWLHWSVKA